MKLWDSLILLTVPVFSVCLCLAVSTFSAATAAREFRTSASQSATVDPTSLEMHAPMTAGSRFRPLECEAVLLGYGKDLGTIWMVNADTMGPPNLHV